MQWVRELSVSLLQSSPSPRMDYLKVFYMFPLTKPSSCLNQDFITIVESTTQVAISHLDVWYGLRNISQSSRCSSTLVGDMISWQLFADSDLDGAYVDIPSQCDGNTS